MEKIDWTYIIIISLCAIASLVMPIARREKLWVYFVVVWIAEIYVFFFQARYVFEIYFYSVMLCNFYLIYYFLKKTQLWIYLLIVYAVVSVFVIMKGKLYNEIDNISLILLYLILAFHYFITQILTPNEIPIQKKQKFWIATGLFIWSIAYAFNAFPLYYLSNADLVFMKLVNNIFHYVTVFSYLLFLIGLNCKNP